MNKYKDNENQKPKKVKIKTLQVNYNISENDLQWKKKNLDKWLIKADVKVKMMMKGRAKYIQDDPLTQLKEMFKEYKIIQSGSKNNTSWLMIKNTKPKE